MKYYLFSCIQWKILFNFWVKAKNLNEAHTKLINDFNNEKIDDEIKKEKWFYIKNLFCDDI